MNALQYLVLGMATVTIIGTPLKAIRRKQKLSGISVLRDLVWVCISFDTAFSSVMASVPRSVQWLLLPMSLFLLLDFFGLIERLLTHSRKGLPSERR